MANAPQRPCLRCRKKLTLEKYCHLCKPIIEAKKKKENLVYEKKRGSSQERGYDSAWKKASKEWLRKHRWCNICKIKPAELVDHIIPHKGNKKLFWDDKNNWQPSCKSCNSSKAAKYEGGFGNKEKL